jgi:LPXTG-site transpeptidase (sortase) family protein
MSTDTSDTLNLGSIGSTSTPHHKPHNGSDNNPVVARDAREKIAALHAAQEAAAPKAPVQSTPVRPNPPASPALEHHKKHQQSVSPPSLRKAKPIFTALASFLLLILLFKLPVIYSQIVFLTNPPSTTPAVTAPVTKAQYTTPTMLIPKINVNAPIVFEPSLDRIEKGLENGVVHYGNTPAPGQPGNSVIVGHSSNDWWEPGNYKFAFVLLDKMVIGDTFTVDYNGVRYIYETTETKVVEATNLSVLAPTPTPSITLITCWPIGTNLKRFIVKAKQVSPKVSDSEVQVTPSDTGNIRTLPGTAPSFSEQLRQTIESFSDIITNTPTPVDSPTGTPQSGALPGAR